MGDRKENVEKLTPSEKFVCYHCIDDPFLKKYIKQNAQHKACSYCKHTSKKYIATSLEDLTASMSEGLSYEWGSPDESGWQEETFNTWHLQFDIQEEVGIKNEALLHDIINCYDRGWCEPFDLKLAESLYTSWNIFTDLITHKYRYTFFNIEEKNYNHFTEYGVISPKKILHELGGIIHSHKKLIINLPKHSEIFRTRLFSNPSDIMHTAKTLGTAPEKNATATRMSPAGIPLFYGALNKETAQEETLQDLKEKYIVTATFKTLIDLKILNLCNLPALPSLFNPKLRQRRETIKFLEKFTREISRPIDPHSNKNIEYIPSQVMSEYFRHCFKDKQGDNLNGIFYPSSKKSTGICCALFIENKHCIDKHSRDSNAILQLIASEQIHL